MGIATQDPELRKRRPGQPEHVVNLFFYVAEETHQIMASLGVRQYEDLVGRVELLEADEAIGNWRIAGIDLSRLLAAARTLQKGRPCGAFGPGARRSTDATRLAAHRCGRVRRSRAASRLELSCVRSAR